MTNEQNIRAILEYLNTVLHPIISPEHWNVYSELHDMISALPSAEPDLDEWCTDCKEYDQKRHCCPRFRRVIRETVEDVRKNAQPEPHYCRECKWSKCCISTYSNGETETYWHCLNWDGGTDEEGFCYEWERRSGELLNQQTGGD